MSDEQAAKRNRVERRLLQGGITKQGLVATLTALHDEGLLREDMELKSERSERRSLQHSCESHANAMTPYGSVVEDMVLDEDRNIKVEIVNPFALL